LKISMKKIQSKVKRTAKKYFRKEIQNIYYGLKDPLLRKNQQYRANKIISNKYVLSFICLTAAFFIYFFGIYCINAVAQIPSLLKNIRITDTDSKYDTDFGIHRAFDFNGEYHIFYILLGVFALVFTVVLAYRIRVNLKPLDIGQKATARWTTRREIREQYKAIPEKAVNTDIFTDEDRFEGGGGFPVAVEGHHIYIDDSPVNNTILGITRSGKGEMFVFSLIDIYSRAEKQASMIATDPKLELATSSYETLIKRGYDVHILNLIDPIRSMGYNPLEMIIRAYEKEDYDEAELLCKTLAFSIYNSDESGGKNEKFFTSNSASAFSAMVLAHIDDCLKQEKEVKKRYDEGRELYSKLDGMGERILCHAVLAYKDKFTDKTNFKDIEEYFKDHPSYKSLSFKIHNVLNIDRMVKAGTDIGTIAISLGVSVNTILKIIKKRFPECIPPDMEYPELGKYRKNINIYSIINTFRTLAGVWKDSKTTLLDIYFSNRSDTDRAKIKYASITVAGDRTKSSIFSAMLTDLEVFTYSGIAKLTAESTFDMEKVGFGTGKPTAIFLGIPDYDRSTYVIASLFIKQLYFTLAKKCAFTAGGKCEREVVFIIDEFGSLPAIADMDNMLTVCLGRNIRFNLIIQSFSQINSRYKESAKTIIGNCGNQVFIQSNDESSAEEFSKRLGTELITTINRNGKKMSLHKHHSESVEEKPLISAYQLTQFMPGECAIARVTKREDLDKEKVKPTPILSEGKYAFKYRWTYLGAFFPSNILLEDLEKKYAVETRRHIDFERRTFDVAGCGKKLEMIWRAEQEKNFANEKSENLSLQRKITKKDLSRDIHTYMDLLISPNTEYNTIEELLALSVSEMLEWLEKLYKETGVLDPVSYLKLTAKLEDD